MEAKVTGSSAPAELTLMGCGDVGVFEPVGFFIERAKPVLQEADLRFAQNERVFTEREGLQVRSVPRFPHSNYVFHHTRAHPDLAANFKAAGFDVVSMASNHTMDYGTEGLRDSLDSVRALGIRTCGAGMSLDEARQPVIIERNGIQVAFLAYASVLPPGYAAGSIKAGVAPMEAHTYYSPQDWQAGTPPNVVTIPYEDQLAALREDIARVKEQVHVVVVSIHWGVHHIPRVIAMYQPVVAHAAIDEGADIVLGHHPHVLKAVEVYKGKVCFYSLGNFSMTGGGHADIETRFPGIGVERLGKLTKLEQDTEYFGQHGYHYGRDSRYTGVAKAVLSKGGVEAVSFLPAYVNPELQPEILSREDARFEEVVKYLEWASEDFPHHFRVEGSEVMIEATA
jgi:hypothetical protein